jgi:hypothetical protein
MDGAKLKAVLTAALPAARVRELGRELGVVERQSLVVLEELVNALVLTAGAPSGGRQADVLRTYVESTGTHPVRGTFYARFNDRLEALLERLLQDSLEQIAEEPVLLPPCLRTVHDWLVIDSETVKLHESLKEEYPGTGDYAAVKVHKLYSLGRHNLVDFRFSPARDHDSRWCTVDESMRGYGLLMDLGYASHDRLRACLKHDVSFVVKLKTGWKARLNAVAQGEMLGLFAGTEFSEALALGSLSCHQGRLDADVILGSGSKQYGARLVALEVQGKGLCVFLTNLPRSTYSVELVGDLYRLRWEIEKNNKLDKSDFRLDELDCRKPCSARTMLYASLLGSLIASRLTHADHCVLAASAKPLTRGPMHVRLVAMALSAMNGSLTRALHRARPGQWKQLAETVRHLSVDPNWRRRPSVLDRLLGFVASSDATERQKEIAPRQEKIAGVIN